ncbi:MAG: hypothetical protein ACQKBV_00130, partial [Puniceicoccales bacterium]
FILWRRTAGGLDAGQQVALLTLWRERIYEDSKAAYEPLRMAGALERLPLAEREALARHCVALIQGRVGKYCDHACWALGRLLTRTPLYGGEGAILSATLVAESFDALEGLDWTDNSIGGLVTTFTQAARRLDHRDHDLDDALRERIVAKLEMSGAGQAALAKISQFVPIEEKDRQQLFGEALPAGLHW